MTEERNKAEEPLETAIVEEAAELAAEVKEEPAAETVAAAAEEDIFAAMQNEMTRPAGRSQPGQRSGATSRSRSTKYETPSPARR